jgi:hypothetical protein
LGEGQNTPIDTPKPFGFSYILMVSVGQEKNEKARFLGPLWTVSDDTGSCGGGDAGI